MTGNAFGRAAQADRDLDALYARVPDAGCRGLCQDSCGPIAMSDAERRRILTRHGVRMVDFATKPGGLDCPALSESGCTVYADRPLLCRLWGSVESMPCPHGCTPPDGHLPDAQGQALLREVMGR